MEQPPDSAAAVKLTCLDFEPVRLRYRRDGWTSARQRAFIAALAETGCVLAACRHVGKSSEAAYQLYRRPDAASFRAAWHAALAMPRPKTVNFRAPMASVNYVNPSTSDPSTSAAPPVDATLPVYSLEAFRRAVRRTRPAPGNAPDRC